MIAIVTSAADHVTHTQLGGGARVFTITGTNCTASQRRQRQQLRQGRAGAFLGNRSADLLAAPSLGVPPTLFRPCTLWNPSSGAMLAPLDRRKRGWHRLAAMLLRFQLDTASARGAKQTRHSKKNSWMRGLH